MEIYDIAHINPVSNQYETEEEHADKAAKLSHIFGNEFGSGCETKYLALQHDLGKLTKRFYNVLFHKATLINHACVGAAVMFRLTEGLIDDEHRLIYFNLSKNHHTGFVDQDDNGFDPDMMDEAGQLVDEILDNPEAIICGKKTSLSCKSEYDHILKIAGKIVSQSLPQHTRDLSTMPVEEKMLYIRLLFSCLVDADYSATASFMKGEDYLDKMDGPTLEPEVLITKLENYHNELIKSADPSPMNELRQYVYECAGSSGKAYGPAFFTMTAPTGTGKTLAMIRFALEAARRNGQRRIFIVLPYLSITQQNADEYKRIFGDNIVFEDDSTTNWDSENEEANERLKLLSQRWSAPIIVTTNVKFCETLFSSKPTTLRKLHNITNSVIVFDESQTMPAKFAKITVNTLMALTNYRSSVVFSTATPPAYELREGIDYRPIEIINDVSTLYRNYATIRRSEMFFSKDTWTVQKLIDYFSDRNQILYIVNTKKKARALYNQLVLTRGAENCFLLSTDLCPADKRETISKIRYCLKQNLPCITVSTQCIEAGVDVDFPCGAREYAPWTSIIQAMGRINRNAKGKGTVLIFEWDEDELKGFPSDSYRTQAIISKYIAKKHQWTPDPNNLTTIKEYYQAVFLGDGLESRDDENIIDALSWTMFEKIDRYYRVIEYKNTINIIVPYGQEMALYHDLTDQIFSNGNVITPQIMRSARDITVSLYNAGKDTERIKNHCIQANLRCNDFFIPTNWFILVDAHDYADGEGINIYEGGMVF